MMQIVPALLAAVCVTCMLGAASAAAVHEPQTDGAHAFETVNSKADFGYVAVRPGAHMFWCACADLGAASRMHRWTDRYTCNRLWQHVAVSAALNMLEIWLVNWTTHQNRSEWLARPCRTLEPCTGCHHMSIFEEPLIIWLQGGPGASSAGYGNFMVPSVSLH